MPDEQILTTIFGENENARLEVALGLDSQSERTIELRRLSWGEGVGWYCQQTLRLDAKEAESLLQALRQNRFKWRDQPVSREGKVIPFPLSPTSHEERQVHSLQNVQKRQSGNSASASSVGEKRGAKRGKEKAFTSRA
jgi:hypothetical protein